MNLLNRYVLKKFLKPFFGSFAALCILLFVSQLFDRLDRFLQEGVSISHVVGFLLTSLPFQALQALPIACLLATLFVVGNLSRTREYIAGLAGGIAPERFLSGLFLAGLSISLVALIANETFVPPATHYARTVFREKIRRLGNWQQTKFTNLFVAGRDGRLWAIKSFYEDADLMDRVVVDTWAEGRLAYQIDAATASWKNNVWTFSEGVFRVYDANGLYIESSSPFKEKMFDFSEKPQDLITQDPQPEEMNFKDLKKLIRHLGALGVPVRSLEVELMMKLAFPFSCFVVVFLGIPMALQSKGSHAIGIAAGGVLTMIYLGFMQMGKALAQRLVDPWIGAWLANLLFIGLAIYLWVRMRRTA